MSQVRRTLAAAVVIFGIGVITGHYALPTGYFPKAGSAATDTGEADSTYKLINPLLFCSDQDISNYTNAIPLEMETKLRSYIDAQTKKGVLTEASLYYKDLNGGPWVLIHGSMRSVPASLLKIPVALAIYKHAEKDPAILDEKFTLQSKDNLNSNQYFIPSESIASGTPYTARDLIRYMLQDSDNGALYVLGNTLPAKEFLDAYSDLGIEIPQVVAPGYTMGVKTYASFFRVLFNASYLSRDASEELLETLTGSKFPQGIRAGLPTDIKVADKFGEITINENESQLHDCGIVYKPHDPYILCIMTHGKNLDSLAEVISTISSIVYTVLKEHE